MNWGKGLITGMAIFMLFILSMCFYMFRIPADEYDHQYYEKGLRFDADFDKERRVVTEQAQPQIRISSTEIKVAFTKPAKGTARFIRPSSAAQDKRFAIQTGEDTTVLLPVGSLAKGRWHLLLEWESGEKQYLFQKEITL
ncbi:FixH family protein [Mucilaginibacter aquariorum]|uniref:FixH family protein n=1 Tax=Mucilaginibacter aquariorum TaxID=2967225 RepID=A0ABT1T3S9_9SPHI|nr:FixH family protein [Mucilaginibacter aquariorum]MCQ6959224.1 FixH family protein [Mucilaginibacter aquariorum]